MKLKYKLKNFFFPHKHSNIIREIKQTQVLIKKYEERINYYRELANHGYLGDSLWDNFQKLCRNKDVLNDKLKFLKLEYKSA